MRRHQDLHTHNAGAQSEMGLEQHRFRRYHDMDEPSRATSLDLFTGGASLLGRHSHSATQLLYMRDVRTLTLPVPPLA